MAEAAECYARPMSLDRAVAMIAALVGLFLVSAGVSYSVGPVSAASLEAALHVGPVNAARATNGKRPAAVITVLDQGWGEGRIHFTGHWQAIYSKHDAGWNGVSSRSARAGDGFTTEMRGTAVRLYGTVGPAGGRASMLIDERRIPLDFYASRSRTHALLYTSPPLPGDLHVVDVVVLGSHDPRSSGANVAIDSVDLTQ